MKYQIILIFLLMSLFIFDLKGISVVMVNAPGNSPFITILKEGGGEGGTTATTSVVIGPGGITLNNTPGTITFKTFSVVFSDFQFSGDLNSFRVYWNISYIGEGPIQHKFVCYLNCNPLFSNCCNF